MAGSPQGYIIVKDWYNQNDIQDGHQARTIGIGHADLVRTESGWFLTIMGRFSEVYFRSHKGLVPYSMEIIVNLITW